jgi:hypothetical protein
MGFSTDALEKETSIRVDVLRRRACSVRWWITTPSDRYVGYLTRPYPHLLCTQSPITAQLRSYSPVASILTPEQQPLPSNFRLDVARPSSLITADATNTADVLKALILH